MRYRLFRAFSAAIVIVVAALLGAAAPATPASAQPPLEMRDVGPLLAIEGQALWVPFFDPYQRTELPAGQLFVRNDTQSGYTALALAYGQDERIGHVLAAQVPAALVHGTRLFYYATFPSWGLTVPPAANGSRVAWILHNPTSVALGRHDFGHLTPPDATVARAGADEVGYYQEPDNQFGPWSFAIADDGTPWLLDEVNNRLLFWRRGQPDHPAGRVAVPGPPIDFTVGHDVIYLTARGDKSGDWLYSLTLSGQVRWRATVARGPYGQLQIGPDGVLYFAKSTDWTPLTTTDGAPLPTVQQLQKSRQDVPVTGGGRLVAAWMSHREYRVGLFDATGRQRRSWRITSATDMEPGSGAVSGMVGADPALYFSVTEPVPPEGLNLENLMLPLTPSGARPSVRLRQSLWGDSQGTHFLIGSDGALYQLRTSRSTGITIVRYPLGTAAPAPVPSQASGGPAPSGTAANSARPISVGISHRGSGTGPAWWLTGAALLVTALGTGAALLFRHHH